MKKWPDVVGNRMCNAKLYALVVGLILVVAAVLFPGCSGKTHAQTVKITAEPVNVTGLVVRIEYCRDGKLADSMHFIDGNGDSIIDGKSGPSGEGHWPTGWEWFDNLYNDVIVAQSTMEATGEKIKIQNSTTYEFLTGEYECATIG